MCQTSGGGVWPTLGRSTRPLALLCSLPARGAVHAARGAGAPRRPCRRPPHPTPAAACLPCAPPPQVRMQREALDARKKARVGLAKDDEWSGDGFVAEAASMVSNN